MKAFLYARVSTMDKGQDVQNQLERMRREAQLQHWEILDEFIDEASANGRAKRAAFDEMLARCDRRECDVVVIWALDRLSREGPLKTMLLLDRLERRRVRVCSICEPWLDPSSPLYEVLVALFAWIAKQERTRMSERTRAGMERARDKGVKLGRPERRIDMEEVGRMHASGMSWYDIARELGVSDSTLYRFVRRMVVQAEVK
jgi:DNA invertase Pin-like site-specific DNA recombinase